MSTILKGQVITRKSMPWLIKTVLRRSSKARTLSKRDGVSRLTGPIIIRLRNILDIIKIAVYITLSKSFAETLIPLKLLRDSVSSYYLTESNRESRLPLSYPS